IPPRLHDVFNEEPRYIDLSWARSIEHVSLQHPRFRDCIADLAAPMHKRAKDELVSEDVRQHQRAKRMARAAVSSIAILALAAIVAALVALEQRDVARRREHAANSRALAAEAVANEAGRLDRA